MDRSQITRWWEESPDANIGLVTGWSSGIVVLDVDGEEGLSSLKDLTDSKSEPKTLRVLTGRTDASCGRCGKHFYFSLPSGTNVRNSSGKLGRGLDVRGNGGFVVAPPSLHVSGFRYEFEELDHPLEEIPVWLVDPIQNVKRPVNNGNRAIGSIVEGSRNSSLTSLAGAMRRKGAAPETITSALLSQNQVINKPPLEEKEVRSIVASVGKYPPETPKQDFKRRPDIVRLSDVQPKAPEFLIEPYIPLGMITILSGDPGIGKTFLALAIAASLTRGDSPLTKAPIQPANVLYLTNENSAEYVLRPRFDAQDGDATRFFHLRGTVFRDGDTEKQAGINLSDIDQLTEAIEQTQAKLVVIDPLQSFLGAEVDFHRSNETRPVMDGLVKLAEKYKCAILIVRHLSKGQGVVRYIAG